MKHFNRISQEKQSVGNSMGLITYLKSRLNMFSIVNKKFRRKEKDKRLGLKKILTDSFVMRKLNFWERLAHHGLGYMISVNNSVKMVKEVLILLKNSRLTLIDRLHWYLGMKALILWRRNQSRLKNWKLIIQRQQKPVTLFQ